MDNQQLDKQIEELFFKDYGYTPKQMDEVMDVIHEIFGGKVANEECYIVHELESEYVHTDVVVTANEDYKFLVTCGMGAREMPNCMVFIDKALNRIETYISLSPDYNISNEDICDIASELQRISKYPFENDTFFGPGHTINASRKIKEKFGYDYYLFFLPLKEIDVTGLGCVYFIPLIPIYEKEREWMVKNNSLEWIVSYFSTHSEETVVLDKKRKVFIPNK